MKKPIALILALIFSFVLPSVIYAEGGDGSSVTYPEGFDICEDGVNPLLAVASTEYTGPSVKVGETTLPLAEHMPGTFFSKNGEACTCHNTAPTYCIESVGNCNCMRYYPTGVKETCEIDLLGAQCFAFARLVFYKCFGFIDHSMNQSLYYSVGSLSSSQVNEQSVKTLLMKAAPGAHVRLSAGHSVSILTMDEDFIVIYHGNAGGDGVTRQPCIVSTRRYTWAQFASACAAGIQYINMPYNYPDSEIMLTKKEVGYYRLNSNLNLRAATNTQAESLTVIPNGTIVNVTEIDGFWGKTEFGGFSGWIFLEYTTYYTKLSITPTGDKFTLDSGGFLKAIDWKMTVDAFNENFAAQNLKVYSPSGEELSDEDFITTGCKAVISIGGETLDEAYICLAGDINRNGRIDVGDYMLAKRAVMGSFTPDSVQAVATDVNGSGDIDVYDYGLIKRYFFNPSTALFSKFQ